MLVNKTVKIDGVWVTEKVEVWKDIKGYEGYYQVSNTGKVRSLNRIVKEITGKENKLKSKILKPYKVGRNYQQVSLSKNGENKKYLLHRLVAQAFIPNLNNKETVNHIDGVKTNNQVENLEWNTYTENNRHAHKIGLSNIKGEKNPNSKLKKQDVLDIRKLSKFFTEVELANIFDTTSTNINLIKNKITWKNLKEV